MTNDECRVFLNLCLSHLPDSVTKFLGYFYFLLRYKYEIAQYRRQAHKLHRQGTERSRSARCRLCEGIVRRRYALHFVINHQPKIAIYCRQGPTFSVCWRAITRDSCAMCAMSCASQVFSSSASVTVPKSGCWPRRGRGRGAHPGLRPVGLQIRSASHSWICHCWLQIERSDQKALRCDLQHRSK